MTTTYPRKLSGLCIGVLSGDRVLFQGPPDKQNGGFRQKILHLTAISAPKVECDKWERLDVWIRIERVPSHQACQTLQFVVEKKVNETEIGYILFNDRDIIIDLLARGLARLRGEKINCTNISDYLDAEEEAKMGERGIWDPTGQKRDNAFRDLRECSDKDIKAIAQGKQLEAVVEEVHPSKATLYLEDEGILLTVNYSEVQVVVLSEKINGENKSNVREIRSVLESTFLNRTVTLVLSNFDNGLYGYFFHADKDIRKLLLENGFAKLSKEAMETVTTKEFMELKRTAELALDSGKGLWKEQKVNRSEKLTGKAYMAIVEEVYSGDSLGVYNEKKNEHQRLFFPQLRAPTSNQAYAFQSRQCLRRRAIGLRVRVEVEFERKINVKKFEGDTGELKNFTFASVFDGDQNLSVYMLEQGAVTLQVPRVEEDITKYFEELRTAFEKGKKDKKGLNSNSNIKSVTFNDLSGGKGKKIDPIKCKSIFSFLQDEKNLTGVVDLVLNGSRFKVRFNGQNVQAIMVLDNIRCLPNEGSFKTASEEALNYSRLNALQRDMEIDLKRVDQKGVFHGAIMINKKDYGLELLEKGLAIVLNRNKLKNRKYEDAEEFARKNKLGIWRQNLDLTVFTGEQEKLYKPVSMTKEGILIDVINSSELVIEPSKVSRVEVPQEGNSAANVQVKKVYSALFSEDGVYYRAKMLSEVGNKFRVRFIDYGNYENVAKTNIRNLSEDLLKSPPAVYRVSLYGIDEITGEGLNTIKDYLDAKLTVIFKEQSEGAEDIEYRVILEEDDKNINQELLRYGEAECSIDDEEWKKIEDRARMSREGKWSEDRD